MSETPEAIRKDEDRSNFVRLDGDSSVGDVRQQTAKSLRESRVGHGGARVEVNIAGSLVGDILRITSLKP